MGAVAWIEEKMDKNFGDPKNPVVSTARLGSRVSMPGMMDTFLILVLKDETVVV